MIIVRKQLARKWLMQVLVILLSSVTLSPISSLELDGAGFYSSENREIRKAIKSKYKMRTGYLYEYEPRKYYSMSSNGSSIGSYDLNDLNHKFKGWPIDRWPHLKVPPEIRFAPGMSQYENVTLNPRNPSTGCLTPSPLRYGDIEKDGDSEVVLILDDEFIVFSPNYERIVFAMFIDVSDWWPYSEGSFFEFYQEDHNGQMPPLADQYHGYSHSWADWAARGQFEPGVRVYTKLFTGDFDNDQNPDILTWQKVYVSNKKAESPAWRKIRDEWTHYERDLEAQRLSAKGVTGEYLPQFVLPSTLTAWQTEHDLTWQKGFPSISECVGAEGELIPEMHDPLLNDPDVLQ